MKRLLSMEFLQCRCSRKVPSGCKGVHVRCETPKRFSATDTISSPKPSSSTTAKQEEQTGDINYGGSGEEEKNEGDVSDDVHHTEIVTSKGPYSFADTKQDTGKEILKDLMADGLMPTKCSMKLPEVGEMKEISPVDCTSFVDLKWEFRDGRRSLHQPLDLFFVQNLLVSEETHGNQGNDEYIPSIVTILEELGNVKSVHPLTNDLHLKSLNDWSTSSTKGSEMVERHVEEVRLAELTQQKRREGFDMRVASPVLTKEGNDMPKAPNSIKTNVDHDKVMLDELEENITKVLETISKHEAAKTINGYKFVYPYVPKHIITHDRWWLSKTCEGNLRTLEGLFPSLLTGFHIQNGEVLLVNFDLGGMWKNELNQGEGQRQTEFQVLVYDLAFMSCSYVLAIHRDIALRLKTCTTHGRKTFTVTWSRGNIVVRWGAGNKQCIGMGIGCVGTMGVKSLMKVWGLDGSAAGIPNLERKSIVATYEDAINFATVAPNDNLIYSNCTICIWTLPKLASIVVIREQETRIWLMVFPWVLKCIITNGSWLRTFEGHTTNAIVVQFVSYNADCLVNLWTIKTNGCIATYDQHDEILSSTKVLADFSENVGALSVEIGINWQSICIKQLRVVRLYFDQDESTCSAKKWNPENHPFLSCRLFVINIVTDDMKIDKQGGKFSILDTIGVLLYVVDNEYNLAQLFIGSNSLIENYWTVLLHFLAMVIFLLKAACDIFSRE